MKKKLMMFNYKEILIDLSPKSGTNTTLDMFSKRKMIVGSDKKYGTYWNYFKDNLITELKSEHKNQKKIKIIRDPEKRALSVYLHFLRYIKKDMSFFLFLKKLRELHISLYFETNSYETYEKNKILIQNLFGNISYRLFEILSLQKNEDLIDYNLTITLENLHLLPSILNERFSYNLNYYNKKLNKANNKKNFNYFNNKNVLLIKDIYQEDYDIYFTKNINKWIEYT